MGLTSQVGDVIDGQYRLVEQLGSGSFGEVWRATYLVEGEDVGKTYAVKVIRLLRHSGGGSANARAEASHWLGEVKALLRVEAGGAIPHIHAANVWKDCAYIAMELLEGATLAARIAKGRVPWRRALFIAQQIAFALEAAHGVGVVHRDLKPQNVILVGSRRACVIDWGIAQLGHGGAPRPDAAPVSETAGALDSTDMGGVGAIAAPVSIRPVGTPGYMAPEVYERVPPSPAHDAFALGVVLYEMLTGRLPHDVPRPAELDQPGASADSIRAYRMQLDRKTQELATVPFAPVAQRCPGLPSEVVALVESLLAPEPARRPSRRLVAAVTHAMRFPNGVPDPPYTGLVALGPEHASLFFGQDATIARVLARLEGERAVVVWGPSGSGKSSLAAAGVGGRMDQSLFLDTDGWRIHVVRPSEASSLSLAGAVAEGAGDTVGDMIVVDQLEEVVDLPEAARRLFCDALMTLVAGSAPVAVRGAAVVGPGRAVRVVATVRDDLESKVARDAPALRPLLERRVIAKGVDANFAAELVVEPARAAGFEVEGLEAVRREVEDKLSQNAATLPIVQFALSEWWARRDAAADRRVLPLSAWKEIGGVDGALSFVAERFFETLDVQDKRRLEGLMLQFFHEGRKQPVSEADLPDPADRALVTRLIELTLVRRRFDEKRAPFYEVEHDSLAQHWRRLEGWLLAGKADEAFAAQLDARAALWIGDGKTGDVVLTVDKLEYAARIEGRLSRRAREYVQAARDHDVRRRRALLRRRLFGAALVVAFGLVLAAMANGVRVIQKERASEQSALEQALAEANTAQSSRRELEQRLAQTRSEVDEAAKTKQELEKQVADAEQAKDDADKQKAEIIKELQRLGRCRELTSPSPF